MDFNNLDNVFSKLEGIVCFFNLNDKIEYTNKSFSDLLGFSQEEMLNMDILALLSPDDKFEFINVVTINAKSPAITVRFHHKTGYHLYFSIKVYKFENSYQIIGSQIKRNYKSFNFDVIEGQLNESVTLKEINVEDLSEFFNESFNKEKMILDKLPVDLWIKDKYHRYLYMNEIMLKRTQLEGQDYYLKDDFALFERDVANDFLTSDLSAINTQKIVNFTFESTSDRFVKWTEVSKVPLFNAKGNCIGLFGSAVDVTQAKTSEKKAQAENESITKIFSYIYDFAICIDKNGFVENYTGKIFDHIKRESLSKGIYTLEKMNINSKIVSLFNNALLKTPSKINTELYGKRISIEIKPIINSGNIIKVIGYGKLLDGDSDD